MKLKLLKVECQRCGKPLYMANRSILRSPQLKVVCGILCSDCATPEEKHKILNDQGLALLKTLTR